MEAKAHGANAGPQKSTHLIPRNGCAVRTSLNQRYKVKVEMAENLELPQGRWLVRAVELTRKQMFIQNIQSLQSSRVCFMSIWLPNVTFPLLQAQQ